MALWSRVYFALPNAWVRFVYFVDCMKRTPLRRVSKKRDTELKEYRKLKAAHLKINPYCEVCAKAKATEIHHKLPLGRGGKLCDVTIFLASCRRCHTRIHDNPKWAEENKYLLRTKHD